MNQFIDFIITYKTEILSFILLLLTVIVFISNFATLPKSEKLQQIQGWLLSAVTLTEKEFGSGTGKIKLSSVYDKFVERFPWFAKTVTFEEFSNYVDISLVEMRRLLATNKKIADIVENTERKE